MAEQKVTDCFIFSPTIPLKQRASHELVIKAWNNLLIRDNECIFILRETNRLIAHREKVLKNLPESLEELPKSLKRLVINAIFRLEEGCREAVSWEERCESALPFTIFNPKKAGEYRIDDFLDQSGHFDELKWARRFVDDEKQLMQNRFVFACFYCLEDKIKYLWRTMKTNRQLPCEGRLSHIRLNYADNELVVIWAYQLENKFYELLEEDSPYANGFYGSGLYEAIAKGHEYAARFFWSRLSEDKKSKFLGKLEFALLAEAADVGHAGVVNFIYSLLQEKQKEELITWTVGDHSLASIYCCLLQSRYYEPILKDLLKSPFRIPTKIYEIILISLSFEIVELRSPVHKDIFEELWKHLKQKERNEVLAVKSHMILNLVKIKAMDVLKMIIQPLPHSVKETMLFNNWQCAGITAIDDLCYGGNYNELRCYLLFFLVDCTEDIKEFSLRSDVHSFFDKFIKSQSFITFTEGITDSELKELNKIIEELQESLKVPHKLLEQVKKN